jgi:hypothetical protein
MNKWLNEERISHNQLMVMGFFVKAYRIIQHSSYDIMREVRI